MVATTYSTTHQALEMLRNELTAIIEKSKAEDPEDFMEFLERARSGLKIANSLVNILHESLE
jgi:Zn-dependent oligopeptidase